MTPAKTTKGSPGVAPTMEDADLRQRACCRSEPECILCPLRPENEGYSLAELKRMGLHAFLDEAGI